MKDLIKSLVPEKLLGVLHDYRSKRECQKYAGDTVVCPICNSHFKVFGDTESKKNVRCHKCGSLRRHRLMYLYLESLRIFESGRKIKLLHFAPEEPFYRLFSDLSHIEYYPCDFSPERYKYQNGAHVHFVDITSIPFEDGMFDFIICNHVLEHIDDDEKAIAELNRVMANGGSGYISVPIDSSLDVTYEDSSITDPKEREIAFGNYDHVRQYGLDFKDRLAQAGFVVEVDDFVNNLNLEDQAKFRLNNGEKVYLSTKP